MGDDYDHQSESMCRRRAQEAKEYAEYTSERAKAQLALDRAWELKLLRDSERAARRRAPDERSRDGSGVITEYDPIARYERETGRR
jgi:hypothetical protein